MITRKQFQTALEKGIQLGGTELLATLHEVGLKESDLGALDLDQDGRLKDDELSRLFSLVDSFDQNHSSKSFAKKGKAGKLYKAFLKESSVSYTKKMSPSTIQDAYDDWIQDRLGRVPNPFEPNYQEFVKWICELTGRKREFAPLQRVLTEQLPPTINNKNDRKRQRILLADIANLHKHGVLAKIVKGNEKEVIQTALLASRKGISNGVLQRLMTHPHFHHLSPENKKMMLYCAMTSPEMTCKCLCSPKFFSMSPKSVEKFATLLFHSKKFSSPEHDPFAMFEALKQKEKGVSQELKTLVRFSGIKELPPKKKNISLIDSRAISVSVLNDLVQKLKHSPEIWIGMDAKTRLVMMQALLRGFQEAKTNPKVSDSISYVLRECKSDNPELYKRMIVLSLGLLGDKSLSSALLPTAEKEGIKAGMNIGLNIAKSKRLNSRMLAIAEKSNTPIGILLSEFLIGLSTNSSTESIAKSILKTSLETATATFTEAALGYGSSNSLMQKALGGPVAAAFLLADVLDTTFKNIAKSDTLTYIKDHLKENDIHP